MSELRAVSVEAMRNVCDLWVEEFVRRFPEDTQAAVREYEESLLGGAAYGPEDLEFLRSQRTSLPGLWGAFWRPLAGGGRGQERAASFKRFGASPLRDALGRLGLAEGMYGEITEVDAGAQRVTFRDLVSGGVRVVQASPVIVEHGRPGLRFLGVIAPLGPGVFWHPSVLLGNPGLSLVAPELLLARLREEVEAAGHAWGEGTPSAQLARWSGIAHGLARRLIGQEG
jgi:hypothetical protein